MRRRSEAQRHSSGIFNEHAIEEVIPLVQMGLAVYLDKPIYLIMPEARLSGVPENLRRMARGIETYDDTLPEDLARTSMEAAVTRLLAAHKDGT